MDGGVCLLVFFGGDIISFFLNARVNLPNEFGCLIVVIVGSANLRRRRFSSFSIPHLAFETFSSILGSAQFFFSMLRGPSPRHGCFAQITSVSHFALPGPRVWASGSNGTESTD